MARHKKRNVTNHYGSRDGCGPCQCWCGKSILRIPMVMIRAGRTESCGRPGCDPSVAHIQEPPARLPVAVKK